MTDWTDEQLLAYADELLSVQSAAQLEQGIRSDSLLADRLLSLLAMRDQGTHSLGEIWRREALSCPSREIWSAYLVGQFGDGLNEYLRSHLELVACRRCQANVTDLQQHGVEVEAAARRAERILATSAGALAQLPARLHYAAGPGASVTTSPAS